MRHLKLPIWVRKQKQKNYAEELLEDAELISKDHPRWSFKRMMKEARKRNVLPVLTSMISLLIALAVGAEIIEKLKIKPKPSRWSRFKRWLRGRIK